MKKDMNLLNLPNIGSVHDMRAVQDAGSTRDAYDTQATGSARDTQATGSAEAARDTLGALDAQDVRANAAAALSPDATNGEKIKALRTAQGMTMAELARRASMSDRAIRYIESNQREPSVEAIQKISAALGVTTDYFMDDATFQKELSDDQFYADVRKKYGSRGVAQAKKIKEQTTALFAGGELSEEDQSNFIKEMEALFLDAKEDAKKFTPKKYL